MTNAVVDAITSQVSNARVQLALLMGSQLEGGQGPTFNPGDQGTSFGPFQIHLPAHPGVTAAEADNPAFAVSYMKGAYTSAAAKVSDSLWKSNPAAAAEQTVFLAERPAQDYVTSRGAATVTSAFNKAVTELPTSSASLLKVKAGGGGGFSLNPLTDAKNLLGLGGDAASSIAGDVASGLGSALGPVWTDAKTFGITMAFAFVGLALVGGGVLSMTKGARQQVSSKAEAGTKTAAELAPLALA
jgi:hypothetical protein